MLRIRLSRVGAKKQPSYRVVVADIESKRDGRIVERIGFYNPRTDPITYTIKEDRALYWLSVGAQPSDAVRRLLVKQGTYDRLERLRAGESLAELVAEVEGPPAEQPPAETETLAPEMAVAASAVEATETVEEAANEGAESVAETASEVIETVSEAASDLAETAVETAGDAVAAVEEALTIDEEE